jgi:chaperonin cofactor prefoldin
MCCWCHHHGEYHRDWPEPCYPRRYGDWSVPAPHEDYVRQLEAERDMLEQRLRRLEQKMEELRRQTRPAQE